MTSRKLIMDASSWPRLFFSLAVNSSFVLLGSATLHAGDRAHEQPTRPHMSAAYSPNWGFNRTCWSRFPAVPECTGMGCEFSQDAYGHENFPMQQAVYTPQNAVLPPYGMQPYQQPFVSPGYGFSQSPISVYPNTSPANNSGSSSAGTPATGNPSMPNPHSSPATPVPDVPSNLPPLPAPPFPAPGQSSFHPNMSGPNSQMMFGSAARSHSTLQTGARYGTSGSSRMPAAASTPPTNGSFSQTLLSNTRPLSVGPTGGRYGSVRPAQQMPAVPPIHYSNSMASETYVPATHANGQGMAQSPFSLVSQNRVVPAPAAPSSYRSGHPLPTAYESARPLYHQPDLPPAPVYPTMPSEPLRSTP